MSHSEATAESICDGKLNLSGAQAALFLQISPPALYELVQRELVHPVHIGRGLVFARSDLEHYRRWRAEVEIVRGLEAGVPPIELFDRQLGRYRLRDIHRILQDWAKLQAIWLVETPRGSFARWLKRFGLTSLSARSFRRLCEALLVDPELGAKVRQLMGDQRIFNGPGKAELRAERG